MCFSLIVLWKSCCYADVCLQCPAVSNTWSNVIILLSVEDVNDEYPQWSYPVYPVSDLNTYVFAISDQASPGSIVDRIEVSVQSYIL